MLSMVDPVDASAGAVTARTSADSWNSYVCR